MIHKRLALAIMIMAIVIVISNIVVQYPVHWFGLQNIMTYSALTYPLVFLTNDIINRLYGPKDAVKVVWGSFVIGFIATCFIASPRIAISSSMAFLVGQMLDILVFTPLRKRTWWVAPLAASIVGTFMDNVIFYLMAFAPAFRFIDSMLGSADGSMYGDVSLYGTNVPLWFSVSLGSLGIKILMGSLMVLPYGAIMRTFFANIFYKQAS